MGRITFSSASQFSLERVTWAFNRAFSGYYLPMTQTPTSLAEMMRENDVRLNLSLVALLDGAVVGISLIALRGRRGWIAGMGIDPVWRRQGLGREIMLETLTRLERAGAQIIQLEALAVNTPALSLYASVGFRDVRELRVYQGPMRFAQANTQLVESLRQPALIRPIDRRTAFRMFDALHMTPPAWQREKATLEQMRRALSGLGLWVNRDLRAYVLYLQQPSGFILYDAGSGGATAAERRERLLPLLQRMVGARPGAFVRAINVPPDDTLGDALDAVACPIIDRQREMALDIATRSETATESRGAL